MHSLVDLACFLRDKGEVIPFVVLPDYGTAEELLSSSGLQYVVLRSYGSEWPLNAPRPLRARLSHLRQRFQNLRAISVACRVVKEKSIDLIHINTSVNEIGYYVAKRTKTPFIWHIREFIKEGLGLEFYNENKVYAHMRKANALVAISTQLQKQYERILGSKKVLLIHNGIDVKRFYFDGPKPKDRPLSIAMVGRVSRLKGHYDAVDALSKLKDLNIRLIIIGSQDEDLTHYAKEKGVFERICFAGYQDDVRPWLDQSHIYLSAHPWEAFGRTIIEAMLAKCCIVAVGNAGPLDIVEDRFSGFLYPTGDAFALAALILQLFNSPDAICRMGIAGQKRASEVFCLERCCGKILQLYTRILCRRSLTPNERTAPPRGGEE